VVEYIFATPSNHRVHHGAQDKYINKNFGATFIFWDRMFGTYQPEEEQAVYGITHNIEKKANPLVLNFHEYIDMWKDIKSTKSFRKKLFYIFGDPVAIAREKEKIVDPGGENTISRTTVIINNSAGDVQKKAI
jgi:hypothetical protein